MFTLTSTVTKFAILSLSAGMAFTAVDAVTLGFQAPVHAMQTVQMPTVVVVGYRSSIAPDTMQASVAVAKNHKS